MAVILVSPPPSDSGIPEDQFWNFAFDNQHSYSEERQAVEYLADEIMQDPDSRFKYSRVAIVERRPTLSELKNLGNFSGLKSLGLLKLWRVSYSTGEWRLDDSYE